MVPIPPERHIRSVSIWFGGIPRLKVHWTMTESLLRSTKSLLRSTAPSFRRWFQGFLSNRNFIYEVSTWFWGILRLKVYKFIGPWLSPCSIPPSPCAVLPPHCFIDGSNHSYSAGTSYTKRFHMVRWDDATKSLKVHWTMTKSLLRSSKSLRRSITPLLCCWWFQRFLSRWNILYEAFPHGLEGFRD